MSLDDVEKLKNTSTQKEAATEALYPESSGGPVQSGLPPEPGARAARTLQSATGIPPDRQVADDIPAPARKTLGDWLQHNTNMNITKVPGTSTETTTPAATKMVGSFDAGIPEAKTGGTREVSGPGIPVFGYGGSANTMLRDAWDQPDDSTFGVPLDPTEDKDGAIVGNVSAALQANRFSPGNTAGRLPMNYAGRQKVDGGSYVQTMGAYNPNLDGLKMSELQKVAEQLLLNAIGDQETTLDSSSKGRDAAKPAGGVTSMIQLGRGQSKPGIFNADIDFRAGAALAAATGGARKDRTPIPGDAPPPNDTGEEYTRKSFGVMNNHLEKFASALPVSMIILAAIATVVAILAALVIALILDIIGFAVNIFGTFVKKANYKASAEEGGSADPAKMAKGMAFGEKDYGKGNLLDRLPAFFGLPQLEAPYESKLASLFPHVFAALTGGLEFFIGNSFYGMLPQVATISAGYYVVVVRNALRDLDQISDAANEMGNSSVGGVEGFFGLVDAFKSSATFRFLITLITIGDRLLAGPGLTPKGRQGDGSGELGMVMKGGKLPDNFSTPPAIDELGSTVRLRTSQRTLSYSIRNLPQYLLRPGEHFVGHSLPTTKDDVTPFDSFKSSLGKYEDEINSLDGKGKGAEFGTVVMSTSAIVPRGSTTNRTASNTLSYSSRGRIPTEFRKAVENELDAYYVPFYFHDLRTNEIMPLPVFVDSISDAYSPSITEVPAFGRMDPVQIYGATTRKIGFSFYMVSTSPEDYSTLYYLINRLVAMTYPQWGGGRMVKNAMGQTFTAPYSNVATASPLVRIRLGELFASNRAPENVRRLFGAHKSSFRVAQEGGYNPDEPGRPANAADMTDLTGMPIGPKAAKEICEAIVGRSQNLIDPATFDAINFTNLFNPKGEIKEAPIFGVVNLAGFNFVNKSGGATDIDGGSVLLPDSIVVKFANDKKYPWCEWTGTKWKFRGGWFGGYKGKKGDPATSYGRIINYATRGGLFTSRKKEKEHDSGIVSLKNKLYYVIAPDASIPGQLGVQFEKAKEKNNKIVGVAVPIDEVFLTAKHPVAAERIDASFGSHRDLSAEETEVAPPLLDTEFFSAGNPWIDAMEEGGGAGLAGFITSLDFDWNQGPWETDADLGRAPKYVKVTLSFSPIHDEPLGLNDDGSLRAAAYPVGETIEKVMGPRFRVLSEPSGPELEAMLEMVETLNVQPDPEEGDPEEPS